MRCDRSMECELVVVFQSSLFLVKCQVLFHSPPSRPLITDATDRDASTAVHHRAVRLRASWVDRESWPMVGSENCGRFTQKELSYSTPPIAPNRNPDGHAPTSRGRPGVQEFFDARPYNAEAIY